MSKEVGYFLDDGAKKKVAKARALDEALLGRHYDKAKSDESYDRIFGKEKTTIICAFCQEKVSRLIITVENSKIVKRCYRCQMKVD